MTHMYGNAPEPVPPGNAIRLAEHHWLNVYDIDGHFHGTVVMQWQPSAKRWCHSGAVAQGRHVDTRNWTYEAPCPMPEAGYQVVPETPLEFEIAADALAFEIFIANKPLKKESRSYPWGWCYMDPAIQKQFRAWCCASPKTRWNKEHA